ncbi:factor-independent urate hydroxylase [Promicromonospora thailandica]|uniref:Uricase n=1 Tax=Promicromonospora thailandica TaxID=765201 RepID=A0A9X2FZC0_9MICO|nr:urate oxidase [Promicromonospora thailandica]MCP2264160.1 urate oxidase [Promicromonospora thailandica]BFF21172.1 urate oxidase [Promicromonospora thailandica]
MSIVLGPNQYGKAEVRLLRVDRDTARHRITDLCVTSQLRGDFRATHVSGDNTGVIATDTQKNTVQAFARDGVGSPETFLLRLARHFLREPQVTGGRWRAEQYGWQRIGARGAGHDHAFVRGAAERRTALVHADDAGLTVLAGVQDVTVLKSTGSEFSGFPRDRYTTLAETDDRILATDVTAWWRYAPSFAEAAGPREFDERHAAVRALLLTTFADLHSLALQQTVFAMGRAVLEAFDDIAEIRLSCPNNHHFLVDLEPFGLDNPGEVFFAADRPYGLIEAAVQRQDGQAGGEHPVWATIGGFV